MTARSCSSCATPVPDDAAFCPNCGAATRTDLNVEFGQGFEERLSAALSDRYRIERELGRGGMAVVYLAQDLKHHRQVALKVLRPELSAVIGTERFLKEIEVTANLQHPHILPLYDSGQADSLLYYVMPYVEGESLRTKLDRDKQLSVEETIEIAKSVASALDYAHEREVVHRDIKPENILLQIGQALVADFGIALAISAAGGTRLTETGLSLGTPHYMSPEQATGDRELDARSDVYSLGAVVYEMLTGEPPHVGKSVQAIVAKILSDTPAPIARSRELVPDNVDAAVHRALAKSPADRFVRAGDFSAALTNPAFTLPTGAVVPAAEHRRGIRWDRLGPLGWGLAAVFLLGLLWAVTRPIPANPVTRVSVHMPEGQGFAGAGYFDISLDGSVMVYQGESQAGIVQLWARRWDALEATPIPGTEGVPFPAVSPNGRDVAVTIGESIRVVPLQGGVPRTLASGSVRCCVRWDPEGEWLYFNDRGLGLSRVPAAGGAVEVVSRVDTAAGDRFNIFVDVLPGGDALVYQIGDAGGDTRLVAQDLGSGNVKELSPGEFPRYSSGYLLFVTPGGTTLMAVPFDHEKLELTGAATPVAEGLRPPAGGQHYFAVSSEGKLVYSTGSFGTSNYEAVWVTRDGAATSIDSEWRFDPGDNNRGLALSPDGSKLAVTVFEESNYDIWVKQLPRGPASRLTFDPDWDVRPRWTPDGDRVTFLSRREGTSQVFSKHSSGTGAAERLLGHELELWEAMFTTDGAWLVVRTGGTTTTPGGRDVWVIRPGVDSLPEPLIMTDFDEKAIALSPDAHWLAYESDETGRNEVYVRPFPEAEGGKWQVSTGGGVMPVWAHSGREIFYVDPDSQLVAAQVQSEPTFVITDRIGLFTIDSAILFRRDEQYALYDVAPDDRRFVMLRAVDLRTSTPELILVQNWVEGLTVGPGGE